MLKVSQIMTENVHVIEHNKSVIQAAELMRDCDCGALPVIKNEKMIGMITDRDIVVRCVAAGKDPKMIGVSEFMTEGISYCFDDESIDKVGRLMAEKKQRRIPVVNRDKKLVGIVSLGDISVAVEKASKQEVRQIEHLTQHTLQEICH